jgi:vancomycin resistance protein YoaR
MLKDMNAKHLFCFFAALFLTAPALITLSAETKTLAAVENVQQIKTLTVSVDQYSEEISKETLSKWTNTKTSLEFSPTYKTEFENITYCPVEKFFCDLTLSVRNKAHIKLASETITDENAIKAYLEDLARKVNRDPSDAKFSVVDGKVTTFAEAQKGLTLNIEKNVQTIVSTLNSETVPEKISLDYTTKDSEINYSEVNNLGISSLLGEGTSNFKGSPANRIHNIKVATDRFNGILIKPGEEFSFVSILGEVDGDHGYLPELVIKRGVTEPEFGGGICQVSTTTFRAAIYSGLKITARKNHAYPVSYYNPQGMDSTVYVPRPDLRFINNTPGYILIQTKIVGTQLTFSFYGTDDERKTTIDGPTITERQPDGALKASFTQHVLDKDGKEIINDVFNSAYASPYRYPHPGGPTLSVKPSNWSEDEWKNYKKMLKDMAKATETKTKS